MPSQQGASAIESNNNGISAHIRWPVAGTKLDSVALPLTMFCEGRHPLSTGASTAFGTGHVDGAGVFWEFDRSINITNGFTWGNWAGAVTPNNWEALGANSQRYLHRVMMSHDGSNVRFYSKGTLWETKANSTPIGVHASKRTMIHADFRHVNSATAGTGSGTVLALAWNRVLSLAEYQSLYDNPWQVFENSSPLLTRTPSGVNWTKHRG
jgi:hypothetical protein